MLTTVPTDREGAGYGLGIVEFKLPNGVSVWGHRGSVLGFSTLLVEHLEASIHWPSI